MAPAPSPIQRLFTRTLLRHLGTSFALCLVVLTLANYRAKAYPDCGHGWQAVWWTQYSLLQAIIASMLLSGTTQGLVYLVCQRVRAAYARGCEATPSLALGMAVDPANPDQIHALELPDRQSQSFDRLIYLGYWAASLTVVLYVGYEAYSAAYAAYLLNWL